MRDFLTYPIDGFPEVDPLLIEDITASSSEIAFFIGNMAKAGHEGLATDLIGSKYCKRLYFDGHIIWPIAFAWSEFEFDVEKQLLEIGLSEEDLRRAGEMVNRVYGNVYFSTQG